MSAIGQDTSPGLRLSVIVPFHKDLARLRPCLEAIRVAGRRLPAEALLAEIIVAADGAVDNPELVAQQSGARVLSIAGPRGPAVARTRAAEQASGDLLVFVDSDVVVRPDALERLATVFLADSTIGAAFGAYDEEPAERGFFSQCKNLAHSFIHQRSSREATTFWAGLGAVRAAVFADVGGFDPRFVQPSVEDIDLGYRIRAAGHRIVLEPAIQGTHLKRWTFWSSIVTDVRDRGVPWTQLLSRYRSMRNDLNLTHKYRVAVVMAYALVAALAAAPWWPALLLVALALVAGLWLIDQPVLPVLRQPPWMAVRAGLVSVPHPASPLQRRVVRHRDVPLRRPPMDRSGAAVGTAAVALVAAGDAVTDLGFAGIARAWSRVSRRRTSGRMIATGATPPSFRLRSRLALAKSAAIEHLLFDSQIARLAISSGLSLVAVAAVRPGQVRQGDGPGNDARSWGVSGTTAADTTSGPRA